MKYFTIMEAERLLPDLEQSLRDALFHKSEAQQAHRELEEIVYRVQTSGGAHVDAERQKTLQARRDASAASLADALDQIEQSGALVKDLDIGLIDFMSRFENRDVCLCWRLGESGIQFWHGVEEGFGGRKPVDREFLTGHSGGRRELVN